MANHSMYKVFHVSLSTTEIHPSQTKAVGYLMMRVCSGVRLVAEQLMALYQIQSIIFSPHVVGKWTLIQAEGL